MGFNSGFKGLNYFITSAYERDLAIILPQQNCLLRSEQV